MPKIRIANDRVNGGFLLNYKVKGNGPIKILFIMGLGVSLQGWENQFQYFGEQGDFTVCVFDNRGTGYSDFVPGRSTTSEMAKDASELLDYLGWENEVHLVGVSMGGMISQELALLRPNTFTSLVLTSTHAGKTVAPMKGVMPFATSALVRDPQKRLDALALTLFPQEFLQEKAPGDFVPEYTSKKESYTMKDVFHENMIRRSKHTRMTSVRGFLSHLGAVLTHYVSPERLKKLREETSIAILVATGDDDNLVRPSNSKYLAEQLDAALVVFEGVGHTLMQQITDKYNKLIEDHIRGSIIKNKEPAKY